MFKLVPGNSEYSVSLNGEIKQGDGLACTLPITDGKVKMSFFGKERWVDLGWLGLMAHFETHLLLNFERAFWGTRFVDTNQKLAKSPSGKVMVFASPITVHKKYRIVPNYTRYAVSNLGEVLDLGTNSILHCLDKIKYYPTVEIYDASRKRYRSVVIHRLVAFAWVANDDWMTRFIVNHKDGNKQNYCYNNLEWTSYSGNANHAFSSGLRQDNQSCRVKDVTTGEVKAFVSVREACAFMGLGQDYGSGIKYKRRHKLIMGRFEFRVDSDPTPWMYELNEPQKKTGRYIVRVVHTDGTEMTFYDTRDCQKALRLWNCPTIWKQKEKALQLYPGIVFEVADLFDATEPVQAYRVATGEIVENKTIKGLASDLSIGWGRIRSSLVKGETNVVDGYAFRRKTDRLWNTEFVYSPLEQVCILAQNQLTQESLTLQSLRQAAKHFSVDRSLIKLRLKDGSSWNNWTFKEVN